MSKPIRFGVIGTGWAEAVALPALKNCPGAEISGVCARNQVRAKEAAQKFGAGSVWSDWREMMAKLDLDAVVICTPDDLHHEMTMAAIKHGLHVACEKPLAMNAAQAREMLAAADKAGVRHMTCYNWRLLPPISYLRALVTQGYTGAPRDVDMRWPMQADFGSYQWRYDARRGNGVLGDLGSHLIDLALWIVGPIDRVSASLVVFEDMKGPEGKDFPRASDSASLLLEFRNGARGRLWASRTAHEPPEVGIAVDGSKGYLRSRYSFTGMSLVGRKAGEEGETDIAIPPEYCEGFPAGRPMLEAALTLISDGVHFFGEFVRAIRENRPFAPSFLDGWEAMRVVDAALESSRTGRIVTVK